MGRYAKANVTEADLKQMIEDNGGLGEIVYNDKLKVYKDLLKVDMDFDHIGLLSESGFGSAKDIPSYETFTKDGKSYPVAWCYANAEGDEPVAFVVYVGQEGKLRAFIPNDGNNFNNAHHRDGKEARTASERPWWHNDSNGDYYFDYRYMRKSVEKRIDVK